MLSRFTLLLAMPVVFALHPSAAQQSQTTTATENPTAAEKTYPGNTRVPTDLRSRGWENGGRLGAAPQLPSENGAAMLVLADGTVLLNRRPSNANVSVPARFSGTPGQRDERDPSAGFSVASQLGHLFEPVPTGAVAVTDLASPSEPKGVILPPDDPVDDRYIVGDADTLRRWPARTIGSLSGSADGGTGCTGVLVGPRHVLTAAHCLHKDGNWPAPIYFSPGQRGANHPNGEPRRMVARYARSGTANFDYGLIILEDEARTASLGWMGMGWYNPVDNFVDKTVFNHGYPLANEQCAASPNANGSCGGFMYADICKIQGTPSSTITYDCDTQDGHSGGPVWTYWGNSAVVLAPHKGPTGNFNRGSRMRPLMWDDLCTWMGEWPSQFASHSLCAP